MSGSPPWSGICALGIASRPTDRRNQDKAPPRHAPMGLAYTIGFAGIRIEAASATWHSPPANLILPHGSEIPPSLAFVLLTLGINFTLFSSFHRAGAWLDAARRILAVYGQTPLFFYLAHLYVCATLG